MRPGEHLIRDRKRFPFGSSAATFLVLGPLALLVGGHDVLFGTMTEARLTGAAVSAAGILMLTAAYGLLIEKWRQAWGINIALLAGLVGAGLGLYLFFAQFPYLDGGRWLLLVAWAVCVSACVVAILRRPKAESAPTDSTAPTPGPRAGGFWVTTLARLSSLGITATLVFNLVQFSWAETKPSSNTVAFGLSVSQLLEDDGQSVDGLFHEFSARVTLKNPTDSVVQILRSTYAVIGNGLSPQPSGDEQFGQRLRESRPARRFESRSVTYGPRKLLEVGDLLNTPSQIQPAQELVIEFEVALPQGDVSNYYLVRFAANFIVAKGDRLHIETGPLQHDIGACSSAGQSADQCTVTEWRIVSPGWLWTLTKGTQSVETVEGLRIKAVGAQQSVAWMASCITRDVRELNAPANSVCDGSRTEPALEKFFGLGYLGPVVYEIPTMAPRRP